MDDDDDWGLIYNDEKSYWQLLATHTSSHDHMSLTVHIKNDLTGRGHGGGLCFEYDKQ